MIAGIVVGANNHLDYSYSRCTIQMDSDKTEMFNNWNLFKIMVEYFKLYSMTYSLVNIHI